MMTQFEQVEVVSSIIEQFNGEIREGAIKRFFDEQMTEYEPHDLTSAEISKLVKALVDCGLVTIDTFGLLTITKRREM